METYLIDTPPPTISGTLHIGHIFSYTQADMIANYQRYLQKEILYPFCFDNNGIPTGKLASNKNIKGTENIIQFSIQKGKEYFDIFQNAGLNFSKHSYHTYDENAIKIAYMAFEKLKENGIIYKKEAEYLYCPIQKTSISQSELNDEGIIERSGAYPEKKIGIGWFIDLKNHIEPIRQKIDEIEWHPLKYKKRIIDWCDNLQYDWSISRERHFGIQIPGETNMTFDTWFISALTPQLAHCSKTQKPKLEIPIFDLRYQSHDIIRTWAFYTIAMSYYLNNQIPWKKIMITGHTLDGNGDKFSKSSGNATLSQPFITKHGTSGIRYWAASNALGTDTQIDEDKMKMGWRLNNKLHNAKKFLDMQIANNWIGENEELFNEYLKDKEEILQCFENLEIDEALSKMYGFFWNKFCDKWIEESKKESTCLTLKKIIDDFEKILRIIL